MGLINRDARTVSAIHSVNKQGWGSTFSPTRTGWRVRRRTIGISHGVSQREVVQRSGVGVVSESVLGMRMEL
jgi:hypothetical protein